MIFLLIVLCAVFVGVFLYTESRKQFMTAVVLKGLASLCFVIIGVICSRSGKTSGLIVCGLVIGCVADVLLNLRLVFKRRGRAIFLIGILVFLTGHILYLAALFPFSEHRIISILAGIVLTFLLMIWIFRQISAEMAFKVFGVVYIGAIVLLNCIAIDSLITEPSAFNWFFAAGALLFLISDIVLILNTFGNSSGQKLRVTNIGLYYAGQILIALSLLLLMPA